MNIYPRETVEAVTVSVTLNGVATTAAAVSYALVPAGSARPAGWLPMTSGANGYSFLLTAAALGVGVYELWLQVTTGNEVVVLDSVGLLQIT